MLLDCGRETSRPPPFENVTNTKDLTSSKQVREMMVLDHSEIHGTEQAELMLIGVTVPACFFCFSRTTRNLLS